MPSKPTADTSTAHTTDEQGFVWRCPLCPRRETFGFEDLRRFLREGWPVCCGHTVMTFPRASEPGRR